MADLKSIIDKYPGDSIVHLNEGMGTITISPATGKDPGPLIYAGEDLSKKITEKGERIKL